MPATSAWLDRAERVRLSPPAEARRRRLRGTMAGSFALGRDGSEGRTEEVQSSDLHRLDAAASRIAPRLLPGTNS